MSNVIINKIKSMVSPQKGNTIEYNININGKPAMETLTEIETKLESVAKKAGEYDNGYGAPDKGNNPEKDPTQTGNAKAAPGVPGTAEEEVPEKKEYDDKYVAPHAEEEKEEPKAEDEDETPKKMNDGDNDADDKKMEEHICSECGAKYKAKHTEEEETPVKKEYDDKYVAPHVEEEEKPVKSAFADFVPGQKMSLQTPTKAELDAFKNKSFRDEQKKIFGKGNKTLDSHQKITQWAMEQFLPKSNKK